MNQPTKPKILTEEEIRIALGLQDWDSFAIASIKQVLDNPYPDDKGKLREIYEKRRTGRTTQMLVEAVFHAQETYVAIRGHSKWYTDSLVSQARVFCRMLGINETHIVSWYNNAMLLTFIDRYQGKTR